MLTKQNLKDYTAAAKHLTNHQRDLLANKGWKASTPFAIRSVAAWGAMGADSNNIFMVWAGEVKMAVLVVDECGECLTHQYAAQIILKERGEEI